MQLAELMKCIGSNTMPHFSIWFGEEQKIVDLYIQQISANYKLIRCDSVSYAISQINVKSLDKSPKAYIITEDTEFTKAENKWEQVKSTLTKSKHILILRYNQINKKYKFYTQNKNDCVEFVHLQPEILTSYIQRDIDLSDKNCEKLISMCGNDYGRILLEVDKLFNYIEVNKTTDNDSMFEELIKQGAIYSEIGDITFQLTDAILQGYPDTANKKLDEAKRKGEPVLRIASILYEGFRNLLSYKGLGSNKKDAGKRTGLTGWQIKQCIDNDGGYSIAEVKRNMLICQSVEVGIKMGTIDEEIALDYMVLSCLK